MSEYGFKVNEEIEAGKKVQRKSKKKKGAPAIVKGFAVLLVLAIVGIVFCATVPVCKVEIVETCEIKGTDENLQIDHYNAKGLVEKKVFYYMGVENGYTVCTYDKNGNILKEESTFQGIFTDSTTYIYTRSKLTRIETRDATGKLIGSSEMQYNKDGTLALKIVYDEENNPIAQYTYSFIAGRLVKEEILHIANNYTEEITYTYEGQFMTNEVKKSERSEKVTIYTYDDSGKVLTRNVKNGEYIVHTYSYKEVKVPVFKKNKV